MTNDLVRHDVNWFAGRRAQRRSAKAGGRRKTVATAQDERRRLITLGLTMTFAGRTAQPNQRCRCRLKTEEYDFAPKAASLDGYRSRNHLAPAVDLPHALPEARGLGVTVRRPAVQETTALGAAYLAGIALSPDGTRLASARQQGDWRRLAVFDATSGRLTAVCEGHRDIWSYYRHADFCMVTSLHDGMNLVAKEFVSVRDDDDGVLILSRFAGASHELRDALIINPYDLTGMAEAVRAAQAEMDRGLWRQRRAGLEVDEIDSGAGRRGRGPAARRLRGRDTTGCHGDQKRQRARLQRLKNHDVPPCDA
jgi:hypothetical protein